MSNAPRIMQLGSITFNEGVRDENDTEWTVNVKGWDGTPPVRKDSQPLPFQDGGRTTDAYRSARILELKGAVASPDRDVTRQGRDLLIAAFDLLRTDGEFIVTEFMADLDADIDRSCIVRRSGEVDTEWQGPVLTFETMLEAADWRKYSTPAEHEIWLPAASGTVTNDGNAWSWPKFSVQGPSSGSCTDVTLHSTTTGEDIEIDTTIASGQTLVIDQGPRRLGRQGRSVYIGATSKYNDWQHPRDGIHLQPGSNTISLTIGSGTTTGVQVDMEWRSAWE